MTTAPNSSPLTQQQRRIAARLVSGASPTTIASEVWLSVDAVESHLSAARKRMGCPGSSPAVLVHALLTAREVPPPARIRPVPDFTEHERKVIAAIAQHTLMKDIGTAIGVRARDVRTEIDAVVATAHARNAAHLVGLAHIWGILGDTATPTRPLPTADSSREPAYEMLTLRTGAERAEAAAFAEDTALLLAQQAVNHSVGKLADLIRSQATVLGLREDGVLVGCLVVHQEPDLRHWRSDGHGLVVSVVPPVPGCSEQAGRLLTLWLADYAARSGLEWVWWEIPATSRGEMSATLLDAVRDLGWEVLPAVRRADGEQVARLRLRAAVRDALTAVISGSGTMPTSAVSAG